MEMELELNLIDLIDADTLSTIEQAFCDMTEMAAGISDQHGTPITAHCNTKARKPAASAVNDATDKAPP